MRAQTKTDNTLPQASAAMQNGLLQRTRASRTEPTGTASVRNESDHKKGLLQRISSDGPELREVPPIVNEVLNSPGQALDASTRAFFEPRFAHNFGRVPVSSAAPQMSSSSLTIGEPTSGFEHEADRMADSVMRTDRIEDQSSSAPMRGSGFDLSRVRIHTDSRAAESARSVNARAYTVGNNIVFGAGQFSPRTQLGRHLLAHELTHVAQQTSAGGVQRKVLQRNQKVPTNFGEFETTKLVDAGGTGVEIILKFHPEKNKLDQKATIDAKKIALSQSVKLVLASGKIGTLDPSSAARTVASGKPGEGYGIDRFSDKNNPIYGAEDLTAAQKLKDTPESTNKTSSPNQVGVNTKYILGHCFKASPTDRNKKKQSAEMWDKVQGQQKTKGEEVAFETTAYAVDGTDEGKYYGSVKWGYKMEGTDAAPTVTKIDITEASKGDPTANFLEPAKLWNPAKTRGTLEVATHPEAEVLLSDGTVEKLAKGTKLKQLGPAMLGDDPGIEVEIIGATPRKVVFIKNSDVKDVGGGSDTKDLPIPASGTGVKAPKKP